MVKRRVKSACVVNIPLCIKYLRSAYEFAFRALHPEGRNFLVVPFAPEAFKRRFGECEVTVCTPAQWAALRDDVVASD